MEALEYFQHPRINLTGAVGEKMIEDLDRQVKSLSLTDAEMAIVTLTTTGGSVGYARAIFEELQLLQEVTPITLVARGICLSAGVTIAMAVPPAQRLATRNTKFLIHEGSMEDNSRLIGPLSAREIQADNIRTSMEDNAREMDWVLGLISEGCGQPLPKLRQQAKKGLWIPSGKKAVKFGLVSGLIAE